MNSYLGIVSNDGQYPSAHSEDQNQLLAIGPMCRHAQDMKPILKVLADKNAEILNLDDKVDISKIKVNEMFIKQSFSINNYNCTLLFSFITWRTTEGNTLCPL